MLIVLIVSENEESGPTPAFPYDPDGPRKL
jgi:hypothetical protein